MRGNNINNDGFAKILITFTIKEIYYLVVGLFHDLLLPISYIVFVTFITLVVIFALVLA